MFMLSRERPLTSTSNHTHNEHMLLELRCPFLSSVIFLLCTCSCRCFGCFTMDVIASVAFATQVDSQNNPDDPFVRHAQMFFSFSFFRPIMLFFSQSNRFMLVFVYLSFLAGICHTNVFGLCVQLLFLFWRLLWWDSSPTKDATR